MGWCRIILSPSDRARLQAKDSVYLASLDAMNAEADRLDPAPVGAEEAPDEGRDRGLDPWGYNKS